MLRLYQRVQARGLWASCGTLREYSSWPAEMSVPDGLKPFDPKGSLGQVESYMAGLPEDDGIVESVRLMKNLRVATDKLRAEQKAVRQAAARLRSLHPTPGGECSTTVMFFFAFPDSVYSCPALQAGPSVPKGLATLPDGSVDADYYTVNQGIHGDFVAGLKAIMAGASPWLCVPS